MSCYEWERGSLKIPAAEWVRVRRELIAAWNKLMQERLELAQLLYAHLKQARKGKRNFDFMAATQKWVDNHRPRGRYISGDEDERLSAANEAWHLVLKTKAGSNRWVLQSPKKKDVPFAKSTTRSFAGVVLCSWDASIRLEDQTRELHWTVPENNRAVSHAWAHPMGSALVGILGKISWTRDSGGVFVGNDEYHRENRSAGGAANFVRRHYGPRGKAESEARWKF